MSDQIEEDIEFIPSDDITEAEPVGPEDDALHIQEGEQSDEPTPDEAADFDDGQPDEAEGEQHGAKDRGGRPSAGGGRATRGGPDGGLAPPLRDRGRRAR